MRWESPAATMMAETFGDLGIIDQDYRLFVMQVKGGKTEFKSFSPLPFSKGDDVNNFNPCLVPLS